MRLGSNWQWRRVCEQHAAADEEVDVWHLPALVQQHLAWQQQQQQQQREHQRQLLSASRMSQAWQS
jgi:hypothetical protein